MHQSRLQLAYHVQHILSNEWPAREIRQPMRTSHAIDHSQSASRDLYKVLVSKTAVWNYITCRALLLIKYTVYWNNTGMWVAVAPAFKRNYNLCSKEYYRWMFIFKHYASNCADFADNCTVEMWWWRLGKSAHFSQIWLARYPQHPMWYYYGNGRHTRTHYRQHWVQGQGGHQKGSV